MFPRYRHLYVLMHTCSNAVVNVSVSLFPPALLPGVYSYGYATPFYNVQQAVRTIVFGTRSRRAFPSLPTYLLVPDIDCVDFWQWDSTLQYRSFGQSSRGAHWFYSSTSNGVRQFAHTRQKMLALPLSRRRTSQVHRALRTKRW